jgi:hypothetical protein
MKYATRYLLPVEILMSVGLVSWGCSGSFGGGALWAELRKLNINDVWGYWLVGVGTLQLLCAGLEFAVGKRWSDDALLVSIKARMTSLFFSAVIWFYICYLAIQISGNGFVIPMLVQAPAAFLFSIWAYVGNARIKCVLDPEVPSSELEQRLAQERMSFMRIR